MPSLFAMAALKKKPWCIAKIAKDPKIFLSKIRDPSRDSFASNAKINSKTRRSNAFTQTALLKFNGSRHSSITRTSPKNLRFLNASNANTI